MSDEYSQISSTPTAEPFNRCLEYTDASGTRRLVPLTGQRVVIGRSRDARVRLDVEGASRRHAEMFTDPFGRWWIRDLGSANGTLVNGFRIQERMLELGDEIEIGSCTLLMSAAGSAARAAEPEAGAPTMPVRDRRKSHIATLTKGAEPKISAQHLTTMMSLARRLQTIDNLGERFRLLCSLMVSDQFGGRVAVVIRLSRTDSSKPPQTLCPPQAAANWDSDALYVTKTLLEAMRSQPQAMLADDSDAGASSAGTGMNPALGPEAAAMSAMACPLRTTDAEVDVMYVMVPPSHGTMEWLTLASLAADQFMQSELNLAARKQARLSALVEHDLQRGRDIQMRLVPRKVKIPGLDTTIGFLPCRWVAGDYVDIVQNPKHNRALMVVADVCGKGLPAALISSSLHTMVRTCMRAGASLLGLVTLMNEHLFEHLPANRFVTGIFLEIDPANGHMEFVNAGHPSPLIFAPDGARRPMDMGDFEPLGLTRTRYSFLRDTMDPGHILFMYTDGLTEMRDQTGRMLTTERLGEHLGQLIAENPVRPLQEIADALNKILDEYQGDRMQLDDRTFLMIRRDAAPASPDAPP